jgi:two-component system, LuxR family, response regulator FixJ
MAATVCVYIVDDDEHVRHSIGFMLGTANWSSRAFAGGGAFLAALPRLDPGCILLDMRMPDIDGMDVLATLERERIRWPAVVMTGHGETAMAVQAMKLGAIDFLEKPFDEALMLSCLERAAVLLKTRAAQAEQEARVKERVGRLTSREREVLEGLIGGLPNKLIAHRLGISLRTVEMHRSNMMRKLDAASLAEALQLAGSAGVRPLARLSD